MDATAVTIERSHREHRVISRSLQKLLIPDPDFRLTTAGEDERAEVEAFIAEKFRHHHNARISTFLPALLNIHCGGKYTAALGLNPAAHGAMFVEQYLDQPAEQAIATLAHQPISRNSIVEVGNLVSSLNGATALLYLMLLAVVQRAGFQWVIFTATPEVQRSIEKIGFKIAPICEADPSRLSTDSGQWGSYYDAKPWVTLGYVNESLQRCHQNLMLESVLSLTEAAIDKLAEKLGSL
ncbi:MAG: thermostable hemolysin [Porticoccaceae bacterium]